MIAALKKYFQNLGLPQKEIDEVVSQFKPLELNANEHFLLQGKTPDTVAFLAEGIMRMYHIDEKGKDKTNYFISENNLLVFIDVLRPAWCSIQAITPCKLLSIKRTEFNDLQKRFSNFSQALHKQTEQRLAEKIIAKNTIQKMSATSRYEDFLHKHKSIALRVPLQYIASYIEVTPQSLSRIRKRNQVK